MEFKYDSFKIVYTSGYLTAMVVLAAYSSSNISSLTTEVRDVTPFRNLQELSMDNTYKLGMMKKTAIYNLFEVRAPPHA